MLFAIAACLSPTIALAGDTEPEGARWVVYESKADPQAKKLPGCGKHIVFVTGDEEYRSEEGMPQLAKILAKHHAFKCTVLFALDPKTGAINPDQSDNIPGLEALKTADLMVIFTRFRDLPDDQMRYIVEYTESGRPIIGLRTATHAFNPKQHKTYERYGFNAKSWPGGFGRQVLGETWIAHHGAHRSQSSRGIPAKGAEQHPILRGIEANTIWDPADVYAVRLPMLEGCQPIVMGQVLDGMQPDSPVAKPKNDPKTGKSIDKNDPMMPLAWIRRYETASGKKARVFATTMGSAPAFLQAGSRRLIVNACYWALGLENEIDPKRSVEIVGRYEPSMFGFGKYRRGVKPADHIDALQ